MSLNDTPITTCPACGDVRHYHKRKGCHCQQEEYRLEHTCPQCDGRKKVGSTICWDCFIANPVTSKSCAECGEPMERKRAGGLCMSCYKRNGRLDPVHRDDGSTLLPLPHGRFTVIDTDNFDRVKAYSWHLSGNGYVCAIMPDRRKRTHFLLHRVLTDAPFGAYVDHIDHDPLNNQRANIRIGTQTENMHNIRPRKGKRFRGVVLRKDTGRWSAQIWARRKHYALGCFDAEEEAAQAYNRAAIELFGDRAVLNDVGVT